MTFYKDYHINRINYEDYYIFDKKKSDLHDILITSGRTTPLHIYCERNDFDMVTHLLFIHKFDVNEKDYNQNSPLHCIFHDNTIQNISIYIIEFLLLHNGNINITNKYGQTPLHLSCKLNYHDITRFLLFKKCNIDALDVYGKTPLIYACEFGHIEQVITLIENNADVNLQNQISKPLHIVSLGEYDDIITQIKIVHLLIDNDADIDCLHTCFLYTPLHCSVVKNNIYLTEFLLQKGANPNIPQILGNIPLHNTKSIYIAKLLVDYKSDLTHKNDNSLTPSELFKTKNKEIHHFLENIKS
jgi:ankyrin repeat protein